MKNSGKNKPTILYQSILFLRTIIKVRTTWKLSIVIFLPYKFFVTGQPYLSAVFLSEKIFYGWYLFPSQLGKIKKELNKEGQ